jgi:hypothetical protein
MLKEASEIFRVRVTTTWRRTGHGDRTTVDYLGPYYTRPAAQGEATKARRAGWTDATITTQLERTVTEWIPVSEEETLTEGAL